MNSTTKSRGLNDHDRAILMASLASRGFYVIGEVPRDAPVVSDLSDGGSVDKRTQEPQAPADGS